MRNLGTYFACGLAALLAIDTLAPPVDMGPAMLGQVAISTGFAASAGAPAPLNVVDRTLKGDRLLLNVSQHMMRDAVRSPSAPAAREIPIKPARQPKILIGCDPAFSPLTVSARLNFANRCLTENGTARKSYAALP